MRPTFLVEFYDGIWCINVEGMHYGNFPSQAVAEAVSLELAQVTGELGARAVVREPNGDERLLVDLDSIAKRLWRILSRGACGSYAGPNRSFTALRDEIAKRVLECAECQLSDEEIVDVVLASFGVNRGAPPH